VEGPARVLTEVVMLAVDPALVTVPVEELKGAAIHLGDTPGLRARSGHVLGAFPNEAGAIVMMVRLVPAGDDELVWETPPAPPPSPAP
jgi:hypothetical protein